MKISSLKLSYKLAASLGLIVILFIGLGVFSVMSLTRLGSLQDEGARRFQDSQHIGEVQSRMEGFYAIVGDAIINMDFDSSHKDLTEFKEQAQRDIEAINSMAETADERKSAEAFKNSYKRYIEIFEVDLLPSIEKSKSVDAHIRELDGKIDEQRNVVRADLKVISEQLKNESLLEVE